MPAIRGKVWKFGNNINTDNMSPAPYMFSVGEIAKHCLEAVRPEFCRYVNSGDIVYGGDNFGTGSSRETAAAALKELGVALVIAKSFARIFFRNAVDIGLPVLICPELYNLIDDGDIISVDIAAGRMTDESQKSAFDIQPIPRAMMDILQAGGLVNYAIDKNWHKSSTP